MEGGPLTGPGLATLATAAAAILGVQADGFLGVVAGAFCGAVVYMLSLQADPVIAKTLYFIVAWLAGVLTAGFAADAIGLVMMGSAAAIPDGVGALLTSAIIVRLLQYLISRPLQKIFSDAQRWRKR
ncbi:hypothetical protein JVX91_18240 [Pseudomonas sp. PDNC002]|uniref:putative holin n=1 Tax=Pseudomonas sp. PDNC002 TaxID=2811422 RepID=UPI001962F072|nr:putative holin [Pseudomonas sp. PDNC002]QRY77535.1 hypothetical protein JVX91_18240 [Pseudomonas sp. PDNC002]